MADEAKKPEAKAYSGPGWGRPVKAFKCNATSTFQAGGTMLQSGAVDRDGVVAMELHPLGVLITYKDKRPQKLVPVGGLTDIDLA